MFEYDLGRKLTFTATFLVLQSTDKSIWRIPQPEKLLRRERLRISPRQLLANSENVRVVGPPILFNVELRRQRRPLASRPMPPRTRNDRKARATQRSVIPGIRLRGCRMIKIQAQLYGMQTQQGVLFRDLLVAQNMLGSTQAFSQ